MLEIPVEFLWKILFRDMPTNYRTFKLRKKNGGERTIYSPTSNLAILQKKLAYILSLKYNVHQRAHGFAKRRSIVTNASEHLNKRYVLNFDLENFFESIEFPRVRNMFISYFGLNEKVATTFANICCHPKGFLPQGAATSPIVSNIITNGLDKDLMRIAKNANWCKYTRYVDDITLSSNSMKFPKEIAQVLDGHVVLSETILNTVEKHGFKINDAKTRLQSNKENQTVTGITVNQILNVNRKYIRRIRSILDCIEKNIDAVERAEEIFKSKYPYRQKRENKNPDMFQILKGMISHVGNVKGKKDPVYLKLANRFNNLIELELSDLKPLKLPMTRKAFHENHTYVVDAERNAIYFTDDGFNEVGYGQGTGFLLKNIGLVTNAHVISDVIDVIKENKGDFAQEYYVSFFRGADYHTKHWAKVLYHDIEKDIAILSPKDIDISKVGYELNESITQGQKVELVGFPDYREGQEIRVQDGIIQGIRMHENEDRTRKYRRHEITTTIYGGNSGGPVVNENNEVIAVAVKGATLRGVSPNEVIPISDVIKLLREQEQVEEVSEASVEQI
ncbi:reverse transcriptase domain-containing protein [Priestia sp. JV24]|uniref:reverse transcriptase domain-containing protein n=1 Tax=Priestia TaxID=2800373 RepID=UPI0021D674D4|nr:MULTISPECIES: reverse transcriptase domain-containing protein [Priestia]MCU7708400.1 reverse transcriptase domain-containing protein [Priestia megaterium]MCW1048026.1 reverse transcriptase domain-containing protein [Priestia sp. JV24]